MGAQDAFRMIDGLVTVCLCGVCWPSGADTTPSHSGLLLRRTLCLLTNASHIAFCTTVLLWNVFFYYLLRFLGSSRDSKGRGRRFGVARCVFCYIQLILAFSHTQQPVLTSHHAPSFLWSFPGRCCCAGHWTHLPSTVLFQTKLNQIWDLMGCWCPEVTQLAEPQC